MRIAGVLAVIDCPQAPVITTDMVEWAVWYSRKSDETAVAFVEEHSAESEEQADAKRILRAFKAIDKPMVNRSDLMERTRLSSRAFDKAYPNLTERDVLVLEWGATSKAGGRPAQLFAKGSRRAARCAA
jgi:(2Fe-2S) ferredoxin